MAMTLEELKKGMSDKVFSQIVDISLRQSTVLQMLTFDDCVSANVEYMTWSKEFDAYIRDRNYEYKEDNSCIVCGLN